MFHPYHGLGRHGAWPVRRGPWSFHGARKRTDSSAHRSSGQPRTTSGRREVPVLLLLVSSGMCAEEGQQHALRAESGSPRGVGERREGAGQGMA
jgi:hypothetical protein